MQRSKCIYPKIRHLLGIPIPSPDSKALGSLTLLLLPVGMMVAPSWLGRWGVISHRKLADVGEIKGSSLSCPFCTLKMLEGVGRKPEF